MQIIFPNFSTLAYADKIIDICAKAKNCNAPLTFNFKKTTWIEPFAITIIAGLIYYCLQTKKIQIRYIPPEDKRLKDYLAQIGFNSFFHINGEDIHKNTSIELKQLETLEPIYIERLIVLIDSKMKLSKGIKDSLKMSMQEIFTNVFDHSKSANGCFVCAQYYPTTMIIRLCITDFGVGILSNLKEKYRINTDIKAIKLSVKEGITSRPQSAGFGLTHIRNFLKINQGTLTIISGKGKVNFYSNKVEPYNITKGFDGTIVNLKINANKKSFYFLTTEKKEYLF